MHGIFIQPEGKLPKDLYQNASVLLQAASDTFADLESNEGQEFSHLLEALNEELLAKKNQRDALKSKQEMRDEMSEMEELIDKLKQAKKRSVKRQLRAQFNQRQAELYSAKVNNASAAEHK